jgi:peptide/nickel transport system ATP-binding protein
MTTTHAGESAAEASTDTALLQLDQVVVEYDAGRGRRVHAVSDVSFEVARGETVGLVGESGCGKSTLGRAIVQAPRPTSGRVVFRGVDLTALDHRAMRLHRPKLQLVVQDPVAALNPRRRIADIVAEPLDIWKIGTKESRLERVAEVVDAVGLDIHVVADRKPHEFSGGQCQRINIARALVLEPELLVCDEVVSALDVSVRAQIINLLEEMKRRYGLTMIFIGHDLSVVKNISDRIAVMYLGKLCELAPADALYEWPAHPYTTALLDSVLEPGDTRCATDTALSGELPSPIDPPSGCRFRTRCPLASALCAEKEPLLRQIAPGHQVACHHAGPPRTDP